MEVSLLLKDNVFIVNNDLVMQRLSRQHRLWRTFLTGLYPPRLSEAISKGLERKNGERSLVLDIGCGSGIW